MAPLDRDDVDLAVGLLFDVPRDRPDQEPADATAAVRPDDDARRTLRASSLDDAGRRIALPDEDVRADALGADPCHDRCRVVLACSARLIDPLPKPAPWQPQSTGVDRMDDHERDLSLEGHPDRDAFRGERYGTEVGRQDDRSMRPGGRSDGDRHAPIVDAHLRRRTCQMAQPGGPLVMNDRRSVG
jgi:hypothetical protein